jgi:hypothetical protein
MIACSLVEQLNTAGGIADKKSMRSLLLKLVIFFAVIEGLGRVNFTVLLLALGLGIAAIVCADLVVTSLSSRAQ